MRLPTWGEPAVGEVAGPAVCQRCGGSGEVFIAETDDAILTSRCVDCNCADCGQPCTTVLCELCDAADLYERDLRREVAS